jgi:hypothetical protein
LRTIINALDVAFESAKKSLGSQLEKSEANEEANTIPTKDRVLSNLNKSKYEGRNLYYSITK